MIATTHQPAPDIAHRYKWSVSPVFILPHQINQIATYRRTVSDSCYWARDGGPRPPYRN